MALDLLTVLKLPKDGKPTSTSQPVPRKPSVPKPEFLGIVALWHHYTCRNCSSTWQTPASDIHESLFSKTRVHKRNQSPCLQYTPLDQRAQTPIRPNIEYIPKTTSYCPRCVGSRPSLPSSSRSSQFPYATPKVAWGSMRIATALLSFVPTVPLISASGTWDTTTTPSTSENATPVPPTSESPKSPSSPPTSGTTEPTAGSSAAAPPTSRPDR